MKTDRRHELQTNQLASTLAHWTEAAKPYGRAILAGIIAIVVAILVWGYVADQNRRQLADGWTDYFAATGAGDSQRIQDIAEQYSGTIVGEWARLTVADLELNNGTNRLFTDRAIAREHLRDAEERYRTLLLSSSESTIRERATYGLARALEGAGELDKARDQYQALIKNWPDSPYVSACEERLTALGELSTKQFYDWIARYEPPKSLSQEPGTPGARPDFLQEPDAGTLQFPSSLGDSAPLPSLPGVERSEVPLDEPAESEPSAEPEAKGPEFE